MADATSAQGAETWGMVGQTHAVRALRHAIASGQLSHAYLFGGPPGVGKTTIALRLAQALSCQSPDAPCLACRRCRQVEAGAAPDVERIAIGGVCDESAHKDHGADGSTRIRICQVRRLERVASIAPFASARRVFIVDSADDLQPEAAHALLKTLEEPPSTVLLILLASDVEALLPTVRSRCQRLTLRPLPVQELAAALRERPGLHAVQAAALARRARGCFGLALRMHGDASLDVLRESAVADARRLARAGRNERFDYADKLSRAWYRERESVLTTLDVWREWWREALQQAVARDLPAGGMSATGGDPGLAPEPCTAAEAVRALGATQRAREHLRANVNAQLALEIMLLDLPLLAGRGGANGSSANGSSANGTRVNGTSGEEGRQAALAPVQG
ncbi:MAG: DNA polymerase III subunit [Dehalococcoidia bacterium]|nr:DNA polymerase III subunit [Dehalococcoidia bacterium]